MQLRGGSRESGFKEPYKSIYIYIYTTVYFKYHSFPRRYEKHVCDCKFVHSDGNSAKVYIFEKYVTRAFQKYILLGGFHHSEKTYSHKRVFYKGENN